jgi:hypothetical protein
MAKRIDPGDTLLVCCPCSEDLEASADARVEKALEIIREFKP